MTPLPVSTAPAQRRTREARRRIFVVLNPVMRFLLRLPWHTPLEDRLLLLTYAGRRSGRRYTVPISFTEDADGSLLAPGGGAWKSNLGQGRRVQIRLRGHVRQASGEIITNPAEVERLLPALVEGNPRAEAFIGVPIGVDGRPDPASLAAALRDGFAVVRLRLVDAA